MTERLLDLDDGPKIFKTEKYLFEYEIGKCKDCFFYFKYDKIQAKPDTERCRLNPPEWILVPGQESESDSRWEYPLVKDKNGCGHWRKK